MNSNQIGWSPRFQNLSIRLQHNEGGQRRESSGCHGGRIHLVRIRSAGRLNPIRMTDPEMSAGTYPMRITGNDMQFTTKLLVMEERKNSPKVALGRS